MSGPRENVDTSETLLGIFLMSIYEVSQILAFAYDFQDADVDNSYFPRPTLTGRGGLIKWGL